MRTKGPRGVSSIRSLVSPGIIFVGHRGKDTHEICLSHLLGRQKVSSRGVDKCEGRTISSVSSTSTIFRRETGITFKRRVVTHCFPKLSFIPIASVRVCLTVPTRSIEGPKFSTLIRVMRSRSFGARVRRLANCSASCANRVVYVWRAVWRAYGVVGDPTIQSVHL